MKKDNFKDFLSKNIKIILKDNFQYNGEIISLFEDCLKFNDRYSGIILLSYNDIKLVRENKNNGGDNSE